MCGREDGTVRTTTSASASAHSSCPRCTREGRLTCGPPPNHQDASTAAAAGGHVRLLLCHLGEGRSPPSPSPLLLQHGPAAGDAIPCTLLSPATAAAAAVQRTR